MKNSVIVIKHKLARNLLKEGYKIIDLVPKRNKEDNSTDITRAVYVFEYKEGIDKAIERLKDL